MDGHGLRPGTSWANAAATDGVQTARRHTGGKLVKLVPPDVRF